MAMNINGARYNSYVNNNHSAERFARLDADGSGALSSTELEALAQRIAQVTGQTVDAQTLQQQMDSNGDGQVNLAELGDTRSAAMQNRQNQLIGADQRRPPHPDVNQDGTIDDTELAQMAQKIAEETGQEVSVEELKAKMDVNGDGKVTREDGPPPRPEGQNGQYAQYGGNDDTEALREEAMAKLALYQQKIGL